MKQGILPKAPQQFHPPPYNFNLLFYMRYVCLIISLFLITVSNIISAEDTDRLVALLESNNLVEISEKFESDDSIQWPRIASQNIEQSSGKEKLASLLLKKIIESKSMSTEAIVPAFSRLATQLTLSGGYSNYVIADFVQRLAVVSLIESLVVGNLSPERIEMLAKSLPNAFLSTDEWIAMLDEEMSLGEKAHVLNDVEMKDYLYQIYALTGASDINALYVKIGQNLATGQNLLQHRDIATLARKMAETETYRISYLNALIFFMKNGGNPMEINLNDVRDVNHFLSKAQDSFASPLVGLPRITLAHLKTLTNDIVSTDQPKRILLGYE